jgi:wyosine [tRNA(Phe)-imidazoG37] synthetase (radical SAM superfamily)
MSPRHVFGPVPSRRLGFSLGVDPLMPKICTMDCVYCELGPTTDCTVRRASYVPVDDILDELRAALAEPQRLDFVTLSGSGEPTLHAEIDRLIAGIRELARVPVAVLTNGSLLGDPAVRAAVAGADVVAPSLDAVSQEAFARVNRPHPSLDAAAIVDGLVEFASAYTGRIWVETLFVAGMNDGDEEVGRIREALGRIRHERVQVNTILRPPSETRARPVDPERLAVIAEMLGPLAEIIAVPGGPGQLRVEGDVAERVIAMASRRPVTLDDVTRATGAHRAEALKILAGLVEEGRLEVVQRGETQYYRA